LSYGPLCLERQLYRPPGGKAIPRWSTIVGKVETGSAL